MKIKRILSIFMVIMLVFSISSFSASTEVTEQETIENDAVYEEATAAEENAENTAAEDEALPSAAAVTPQVNEKSAQEAYEILTGTGILPNAPAIDVQTVSRGDFATMVTALSGVEEIVGADTLYRDVTASNSNFSAISHAVSNGWMTGNKGLFKPDDPIILSDALRALIGMLTHNGAMNEAKYLNRARSLGLLSGVKAGLDTPLSGSAVCKILYNALKADYMEEYGVQGTDAIYKSVGSLLSAVHKIRIVSGIVTATNRTGLYNSQDVSGIKIGETTYFSENDYSSFLGMHVDCYVDYSPSKDGEAVLVRKAAVNEVVDLVAEDIENLVNKETLYYYPEKDSNRKNEMRMSSVTPVIYNGIYSGTVSNFSTLQLTLRDISDRPECATLKLIDNNDDGRADAVIVWYYETYVISYADGDNMYYRDAYAKKSFSLMDYEDAEICVNTNGKPGKIGDLREKSVASVAISADKKIVDIYINSGVLYDASVDAMDDTAFEISGNRYEKSAYYDDNYAAAPGEREKKNTIKLGAVGTIYLDFLNRIVMGNFENELNYAYITAAGKKGTLGDKYEVKMFVFDTQTKDSEFKIYPLKERFKLDGSVVKRKNVVSTVLYDGSGNVVPQLIKYRVNAEGEIEEIQTADTSKTLTNLNFGVNDHWYSEGALELNYQGQAYYNSNAMLLGNKFRVSSDSNVLVVPTDVTDEDSFTVASTPGQVFTNGSTYSVEIYDVQKSSFANIVIYRSNATVSTGYSYKRTFFVRNVKYARTENGEYVQQLSGYGFEAENWLKIRSSERVYMTSDDFKLTVSYKASQHGISVEGNQVKAGDIIRFNTDGKGVIQNARLEFRYSSDAPMMNYMAATSSDSTYPSTENEYLSGTTFGYSGAEGGAAYGKVAFHESGSVNLGLTYDDGATMQVLKRYGTSTTPFIVYDTEEKTVKVTTTPDVRTCLYDGANSADTAFVLGVYNQAYMIVIYK